MHTFIPSSRLIVLPVAFRPQRTFDLSLIFLLSFARLNLRSRTIDPSSVAYPPIQYRSSFTIFFLETQLILVLRLILKPDMVFLVFGNIYQSTQRGEWLIPFVFMELNGKWP